MKAPEVLLAKSAADPSRPRRRETLVGHTLDVLGVTEVLLDRIAGDALRNMGLGERFGPDLRHAVRRGTFLHDLGKANHQFQRMLRDGGKAPQALRHEWISAWLPLASPQLDAWLFADSTGAVRFAALFAVCGHHLKADDAARIQAAAGSGDAVVTVYSDHPDIRRCIALACDQLALGPAPSLPALTISLVDRPLGVLRTWLVDAQDWFDDAPEETRRFVALVKALIVAADVAGSALPRVLRDPEGWTRAALERVCGRDELAEVAGKNLKGRRPRPFQEAVAGAGSRVSFVRAGCGSGKTVAAYLWASQRAAGRKLFVCYPTTGTATEGFRDYVLPAEMSADAALLHGRSELDLEELLGTPEDDPGDIGMRLQSLAGWDVPLILCTADQVLGLVQNQRRPLFTSPSIVAGAFVFDEIHQYDGRLFGALLRFLEAFPGAPVLLMTASLPEARLDAIRATLRRQGQGLQVIDGPADLERIERYDLRGIVAEPPWREVEACLDGAGKVLWVANTVDRCVRFAQEARARGFSPVLPYHSRYRYGDRIRRHEGVIEAFRHPGGALAVTTQVCEVSLDLSADLLVSDLAPVPALIQRLGRLNRRVTPEAPGTPCPAFLLAPGSPAPYEAEDLDLARRWLKLLRCDATSQADLAATFEAVARDEAVEHVKSEWLDGGAFSHQAPLRDAGQTFPVVRGEDREACLDWRGRPVAKEVTRNTVPMTLRPVAREIAAWPRLGFVFVAPAGRIAYSEAWGASWARP